MVTKQCIFKMKKQNKKKNKKKNMVKQKCIQTIHIGMTRPCNEHFNLSSLNRSKSLNSKLKLQRLNCTITGCT